VKKKGGPSPRGGGGRWLPEGGGNGTGHGQEVIRPAGQGEKRGRVLRRSGGKKKVVPQPPKPREKRTRSTRPGWNTAGKTLPGGKKGEIRHRKFIKEKKKERKQTGEGKGGGTVLAEGFPRKGARRFPPRKERLALRVRLKKKVEPGQREPKTFPSDPVRRTTLQGRTSPFTKKNRPARVEEKKRYGA